METGYLSVFYVQPDADFEKLAHKGRAVDLVLVPKQRQNEFMQSSGYICLMPLLKENGQLLFYD